MGSTSYLSPQINNQSSCKENWNPLDLLAEAAISSTELSVPINTFLKILKCQPENTMRGVYKKATDLIISKNKVVPAPGFDDSARMVASARFKDRPHLVVEGKQKGEFRYEIDSNSLKLNISNVQNVLILY